MEKRIFNLIILDESGSMESIKQPAINGVNETLQTVRAAQEKYPEQQHYVTLVSFNSCTTSTIYNCAKAAEAKDLAPNLYNPNCCTPLYDAMGFAINDLKKKVAEVDTVLVTIITDGYENASREYNGRTIKELVEGLRQRGWVFTYIGANQDAVKVAESMAINNSLNWSASEAGTNQMFACEIRSRDRFYARVHRMSLDPDSAPNADVAADYFADDEEENKG